jgi:hypothetical protein
MTASAGMASWRDLEQGAPEIARLGLARLTAVRVAMLGTLRSDGSPRISPIEPYIVNGRVLVGAMAWSKKARGAAGDAWWNARPPEQAIVFTLRIATALFVEWNLAHGLMTVHRWTPRGGYNHTTGGYP